MSSTLSPPNAGAGTPLATSVASTAMAIVAVALPVALAHNVAPSATFFNQAAAFIGWGVWLLWLAFVRDLQPGAWTRGAIALTASLTLVVFSALGSWFFAALPPALSLSAAATVVCAMLVVRAGASLCAPGAARQAFAALCLGLVVAGALSVVVAVVQVFFPDVADGTLIASASAPGRASGNVRQPNHLSSLLLWSQIAAVWLFEAKRLRRAAAVALSVAFIFSIVLSASRTGLAGVIVLAVWGAFDKRLSRDARWLLIAAPLVYLLGWAVMAGWSHWSHHAFSGETRLTDTSESPNSRLNIWANALSLIARHPWLGVGFGEFNFAWSLTPFPHRPTAFFDHTHNLPLQLAVEMGLPLAVLVMVLLAYALWRAFTAAQDLPQPGATMKRTAFVMVLMALVHSLLEYPLWYAYFLLPTAFAWGLCLSEAWVPGGPPGSEAVVSAASHPSIHRVEPRAWLAAGCAAMLIGGAGALVDYLRVARIFSASSDVPLAQRIAAGEHSWFFAHHAYYAAATTEEHPSQAMPAFKVATHYLLDTRLMIAWAKALNERGEVDKARYIAQRLREFRNDDAESFFAPCDDPPAQGGAAPFQCSAPSKAYSYRDFE